MAAPERYDALVLGSGQGGKLLAWDLARSGRRTAVVERQLDRRLVPEHQLHAEARTRYGARNVAYLTRHAAEFGDDDRSRRDSTW